MRLLHTNDFHGTLDATRVQVLQSLRTPDCLYFDTGDCIRTGNLGIPLRPEPAWEFLAAAGCNGSVLGNRETHILDGPFRQKLSGVSHPVLVANLFDREGKRVFPASHIFELNGLRVGVVGGMVAMVTDRMKSAALSAFRWTSPIEAVAAEARLLRPQVELLIALTHIGHRQDLALAERCPELDVILGGHSHTVLPHPVQVGRTAICQGGSHGRYVGVYEWEPASGLSGELRPFADLITA